MNLAIIEAKLEFGRYRSANRCIQDFKLIFSECCKRKQFDDAIVEKAFSPEKFFETELALTPKEEQEVKDMSLKKPANEISGLQDLIHV